LIPKADGKFRFSDGRQRRFREVEAVRPDVLTIIKWGFVGLRRQAPF
jgi:hypothetical protein